MGDQNARQKLAALAEMTALYKQYQQQLSWMGSNLNQAVKRANELAIGQQLTGPHFQQILFPRVQEVEVVLNDIKDRLYEIARWLTK